MRRTITVLMIVGGSALMVVSYFFLAAPFGAPAEGIQISDPRMPFAPLLFILGVALVFGAAVVYELLPERKR